MIDTVNAALMEMQGALLARSLYPEGHPRIRVCEERAREALAEALKRTPEVTLFGVDGRVVFESRVLPSSDMLSDTLFRMLQLNGIDRITFRRGVEADEIRIFLDALALGEKSESHRLMTSPHLGFGYVDTESDARSEAGVPSLSELADVDEAGGALGDLWDSINDQRICDMDLLGDIVTCLSSVVRASSGAMMPLAPLKRHDEYTFVHTMNVAILATALAEAVGFERRDAHDVSIAALLHDVGKQAIPDTILNKNGRFTHQERIIMELHPVEGARMLLNTPGVPELAAVVAYEHHIRVDGSGYPSVPANWRLSLASRIVQIADVFDALRTHRPYRAGMPVPKIVELMRNDVGLFFDADLLHVFLTRVVARGIPEEAAALTTVPASLSAPRD